MEWYNYISAFFAGLFLTNFIPHFVNGISGDPFPTVFSKPRGQGLSSPVTNVLWALFNLVIGYLLFRVARISGDNYLSLIIFLAGIAFISLRLAKHFSTKHKAE